MDLINKLSEFDEKVVTSKAVNINGVIVTVRCYPKVKDIPCHYSDRNIIIKMHQKTFKKGTKHE